MTGGVEGVAKCSPLRRKIALQSLPPITTIIFVAATFYHFANCLNAIINFFRYWKFMLRNQVNVVSKAFTLLFPKCMMLHSLTHSNEIFTTKSTFTQIRTVKKMEKCFEIKLLNTLKSICILLLLWLCYGYNKDITSTYVNVYM